MFDHKLGTGLKIFLFLPLLPIGWTILYLNRYSGIDSSLRLGAAIILVSLTLAFTTLGLLFFKRRYQVLTWCWAALAGLIIVGSSYFTYVNIQFYNALNEMVVTQTQLDFEVAVAADSPFFDLEDLQGQTIGVLDFADDPGRDAVLEYLDAYQLSMTSTLQMFESPVGMLHALYQGEIEGMILGAGFKDIFSNTEGFENIYDEVRILRTIEIITEVVQEPGTGTLSPFLETPFSILLLGLDVTEASTRAARSDSIILATVNPQELSVTMTSIPRDSYVPNPFMNNMMDKINHSFHGGPQSTMEAVSQMFDMEVDYYISVNFTAVVDLVEALGGITVDVPITFSEQNSRRQFGRHMIHLEKGLQELNGEEALALSRHRKSAGVGDRGRALHQQLVLQAILEELISGSATINEYLDALAVMGSNIETNLTLHQMTAAMQFLIDQAPSFRGQSPLDVLHIISMVLTGDYGTAMTPWFSRPLSVFFPFQGAIQDARDVMMVNLGKEPAPIQGSFHFNGFEPLSGRRWIQNTYWETPGASVPPPVNQAPPVQTPPAQAPPIQTPAPPAEPAEPPAYQPPPPQEEPPSYPDTDPGPDYTPEPPPPPPPVEPPPAPEEPPATEPDEPVMGEQPPSAEEGGTE